MGRAYDMKKKQMWVYPEFVSFMKIKAAENGKDVISYTKDLLEESDRTSKKKINNNFWRLI